MNQHDHAEQTRTSMIGYERRTQAATVYPRRWPRRSPRRGDDHEQQEDRQSTLPLGDDDPGKAA